MDQQTKLTYMSYKTNVLIILNVYIVFRAWFPDSAIKRAIVIRGFKFLAFHFFFKWLGSQNEFRLRFCLELEFNFVWFSPKKSISQFHQQIRFWNIVAYYRLYCYMNHYVLYWTESNHHGHGSSIAMMAMAIYHDLKTKAIYIDR